MKTSKRVFKVGVSQLTQKLQYLENLIAETSANQETESRMEEKLAKETEWIINKTKKNKKESKASATSETSPQLQIETAGKTVSKRVGKRVPLPEPINVVDTGTYEDPLYSTLCSRSRRQVNSSK